MRSSDLKTKKELLKKKRIPVPLKPPKVEPAKKKYNRKKNKRNFNKDLKENNL
jgi:hypothetical protein